MSNVQIFDTEISGPEVTTLYNYGSPIQTLANIPQNSNLKAWYKLDASEVYNSTTTEWEVNEATSPWTSSLDFNGSSDYVNINSVLTQLNSTTVGSWSCWVKPIDATPTSQNRIIQFGDTNGNGFLYIRIESDGKIGGQARNSGTSSWSFESNSPVFSNNTWTHIVLIQNGVQPKIYKNGVEVPITFTISTDKTAWFSDLPSLDNGRIGVGNQNNLGEFQFFEGSISNSSMWNIDLTPSQVTELYNNGTPSNLLNHSVTSNLVSWWKLNNTTTGIEDSKGSNNGTNNGATEVYGSVSTLNGESSGMSQANLVQSDLQTVAPYSKYAMDFDGSSGDYIDCGNVLDNIFTGSDFSVSTWIYATTNTTYNNFFNKDTTVQFYLHSNKIKIYLGSGSSGIWPLESTATLSLNTWYNIIFTRSGNENKLYINASLDNSATSTGSISASTGSLTLSSYRGGSSYFWDGSISNPSVWNTALTPAQVAEIYNQGIPGNLNSHSAYSNLVSWWQLGENSSFDGNDWIVADEKGSNNGTSVSMPIGALVNGVGTTANGVSSGMSEGNLVGDAPYSTANALSTNMVITSRVSGVSDATITTGGTGYVTGTNIATTGGSGTNCTINITTVSGGVITAITINNGGSNYVIGDVLTISGGNGNATITVSGLNTP
jgi:hypothetical protein